jgi:DNA replication and repair protein RecF
MSLSHLVISQLRCIEQAELDIPAGLTLVWGPNASGKTSLLEAIFLLGRGRSFRTRNSERLIRHGQDHLRVIGDLMDRTGLSHHLGIEVRKGGTSARIDSRPAESLAELAQAFPVQAIEPGVHRLVEEGGYRRRRWMDWAVFHVEPQFVDTWLRYTRALKQRNAALRVASQEASVWNAELSRTGETIAASRARYIAALEPWWRETVLALSGLDVELHYQRGWTQDHSLDEALVASRLRDEARHATHSGPHRADVAIRVSGRPAREVLSRGQQKLVAVAMILAQLKLLQSLTGAVPTLLLDDPAAELDGERLQRFIEQIQALKSQLVVTSLSPDSRLFGAPDATFQAGQGRVQPV